MPRKLDYLTPIDDEAIGARVKELRDLRGLTQGQLAEKIGMDQSLLSRYERGNLRLHAALLASLARVFKTSTDEILGLKDIKDEGLIKDKRFLRRLAQIDSLSKRKKEALLTTLDSFLNENR